MKRLLSMMTLMAAIAFPLAAWAQETAAWEGRVFVNLNVGAQTGSPNFGFSHSTTLFNETAKAGLNVPGKSGMMFDLGGGVRLVQNLGFGVTYSRYDKERTAELTTTIPSPLFFGDFSTTSETRPLRREEDAVHFQAVYRIPFTTKVQVGVFGGPTYFRCRDDIVTQFSLLGDFSPALDWNVQFREVNQTVAKDTAWGYNGGADVVYLFARHVGLTGAMRYSKATHKTVNAFENTSDLYWNGVWGGTGTTTESVTMNHGGMHWNGGLTFRF